MRARYRYTENSLDWIDADYMKSWGAFDPGRIETLEFDTHITEMAFEMHRDEDRFTAHYSVPGNVGVPQLVRSIVWIERCPMPFGGERVYFRAPCCGKRVLGLALLGDGLYCNDCGKVTWASRRMTPLDRKIHKANKLSRQLGGENWISHIVQRPRYMRQVKYDELRLERNRLVQEINDQILRRHAWALEALGYNTNSVFAE